MVEQHLNGKSCFRARQVPGESFITQVTHSGNQPLNEWVLSQERSVEFFIMYRPREARLCDVFHNFRTVLQNIKSAALATKGCAEIFLQPIE